MSYEFAKAYGLVDEGDCPQAARASFEAVWGSEAAVQAAREYRALRPLGRATPDSQWTYYPGVLFSVGSPQVARDAATGKEILLPPGGSEDEILSNAITFDRVHWIPKNRFNFAQRTFWKNMKHGKYQQSMAKLKEAAKGRGQKLED